MSHHRDHMVEELTEATGYMDLAIRELNAYWSAFVGPEANRAYLRVAQDALDSIWKDYIDIMAMIENPDPQILPDIRRRLNKAREEHTPDSALHKYADAVLNLGACMNGDETPGRNLENAIKNSAKAWGRTDFVLWHCNDAIAEELP